MSAVEFETSELSPMSGARSALMKAGEQPAAFAPAASPDRIFRDLVRSHQKSLQAFVLRRIGNQSDAEELTQQAFVEASRTIATFKGDSALSSWLYGIAMNLVRNHLSRSPRRRFKFEDESTLESIACPAASPERHVEGSQLLARLSDELDSLPAEMRDLLMMVAVDEMSYEEAATMLSIPIGTVRSRLSRARSTLRTNFARAGIDSIV